MFTDRLLAAAIACTAFVMPWPAAASAGPQIESLRAYFSRTVLEFDELVRVSPDGNWISYSVSQMGLHAINTQSAAYRNLAQSTRRTAIDGRSKVVLQHLRSSEQLFPGRDLYMSKAPVWSPDNRYVAFIGTEGADMPVNLWVFDVQTRKTRKLGASEVEFGLGVNSPTWTPDSRRVLIAAVAPAGGGEQLTDQQREQERCRVTSVSSLSKHGARPCVYSTAALPIEGAANAIGVQDSAVQDTANLVLVDVSSGSETIVVPLKSEPAPVKGAVSPSGKWLAYYSPAQFNAVKFAGQLDLDQLGWVSSDLVVVSMESGEVVHRERDVDYPSYGGPDWLSEDRLALMRAGKVLLVSPQGESFNSRLLGPGSGRVEDGFNGRRLYQGRDGAHLIALEIEAANTHETVTALLWISTDEDRVRRIPLPDHLTFLKVAASAGRQLWQPRGSGVVFTAMDNTSGESLLIHVGEGGSFETLWRGRGDLVPLDIAPDHATLYAVTESNARPSDIWAFSSRGKMLHRVSRLNPRLDTAPELAVGDVVLLNTQVPGWDGGRIRTTTAIILPVGVKRGAKLPAVVSVYPNTKDYLASNRFAGGALVGAPAGALLKRGYAVVYADLPTRPFGNIGDRAKENTDVLLPQLHHAAAQGYIDLNRLALHGISQGGFTVGAIASHTNLFRAVLAGMSGGYDLAGSYGFPSAASTAGEGLKWGHALNMGGPPWKQLLRYLQNSPFYQVERINTPFFLYMGGAETEVGFVENLKFFSALQSENKPAQLVIYPGEGHAVFTTESATDLALRIMNFLDTHVKNAP